MGNKIRLCLVLASWLTCELTSGLAIGSTPLPEVEPTNWTAEIFVGPANQNEFQTWIATLKQWRDETRAQFTSTKTVYDLESLKWTQKNFVQTQAMIHDRFLFENGLFTVDRYLNDLKNRYGGVDSVLLWPTYPNIGIDERNQYDLARDLPGGLKTLKSVVKKFHDRVVYVLLPLNPWDNGTRDEGVSHSEAIAKLLEHINADGFNGDTMKAPGEEYFLAAKKNHREFAIEPEVGLGDDFQSINWNPMSWGYWMDYTKIPGVDRYKWLEPRHMSHVCRREVHDRNEDLQYLWFNGGGYESWENLWGIWNGITPRDAEVLRRLSYLQRSLSDFFISKEWQPHTPTLQPDIYSTQFPLVSSTQSSTLWTFINRSDKKSSGPQIAVPYSKENSGEIFYDLWNGQVLKPQIKNSQAILEFDIEAHGYGAVVSTQKPSNKITAILNHVKAHSIEPISNFSNSWTPLSQNFVAIQATSPASKNPDKKPAGMILIPAVKNYNFKVSGIEIEQYDGVDVQYPWESQPQLVHDHIMSISAFYIDTEPVSNSDFKTFLNQTNYIPADSHNFLRDWVGGSYPKGAAQRPVTWISLEDARAYTAWVGKRLPHEWEWQYAAQGTDGRIYPWGDDFDSKNVSVPHDGRFRRLPDENGKLKNGASPFGVLDLVGNVWQMTDEVYDDHTRAVILRGGSNYFPQGSQWYFPNTNRLDEHGKYLLMAPSLDRSGTVGFRCVEDAR